MNSSLLRELVDLTYYDFHFYTYFRLGLIKSKLEVPHRVRDKIRGDVVKQLGTFFPFFPIINRQLQHTITIIYRVDIN